MDPGVRSIFLDVFSEFPALWDKSCQEFGLFQRKATYRNEIWEQILARFRQRHLNVPEDGLRQMWMNMRNDFIRYKFPQNASKNFIGQDHEERLHKSLDIMSQQFFKEELLSQQPFSQQPIEIKKDEVAENIRKEKSEPLSQDVEKVSTTANIPISHGLSVYTAIRKTQVNTEVDIEKKPDMYVSNSFLKKKRVTDGDEGYCEAPKQAKLLRTIETQTDCSFLKKNILPQVTRSKDELASVQITFFLNSADRKVVLHEQVKTVEETQYDEIATGPDYSTLGNHFTGSESFSQLDRAMDVSTINPYDELSHSESSRNLSEPDIYIIQSL